MGPKSTLWQGIGYFKDDKVHEVLSSKVNTKPFVQAKMEDSFSLSKLYRTAEVLTSDRTVNEAGCECALTILVFASTWLHSSGFSCTLGDVVRAT